MQPRHTRQAGAQRRHGAEQQYRRIAPRTVAPALQSGIPAINRGEPSGRPSLAEQVDISNRRFLHQTRGLRLARTAPEPVPAGPTFKSSEYSQWPTGIASCHRAEGAPKRRPGQVIAATLRPSGLQRLRLRSDRPAAQQIEHRHAEQHDDQPRPGIRRLPDQQTHADGACEGDVQRRAARDRRRPGTAAPGRAACGAGGTGRRWSARRRSAWRG